TNEISKERIFIPDLYPQISQITADFVPQRPSPSSSRYKGEADAPAPVSVAPFESVQICAICGYRWNSRKTRYSLALTRCRGSWPLSSAKAVLSVCIAAKQMDRPLLTSSRSTHLSGPTRM